METTLNVPHPSDTLDTFLLNCHDFAPQGSDEWLAGRRNSFGGSEMAALLGEHKYKSHKDLVIEKIMTSFSGIGFSNPFMAWGTLFEPVHRLYMQDKL